jgi:hypothetical protein
MEAWPFCTLKLKLQLGWGWASKRVARVTVTHL